eukprot:m.458141 g.458141  ORF g.458141 m.458141 type:complete len:586 (+) comp21431_c0_seq1:315-2072(+)
MAATSNFETQQVTIKASKKLGYGFSIMGGDLPRELREEVDMSSANLADRRDCSPVYISKIKPNTPADGKVKVGAQIIEINGLNIVGQPHTHVIAELKRAKGEITLLTRIPKASSVYLAQVSYEKVQVLFRFHAQKDDELELVRGDVVYVMGKGSDGWAYGVCQRTGLSGMFPGNFAIKIKPPPEMIDSLYSELEARNPGFSHHGKAEVLYDQLPGDSAGDAPAAGSGNASGVAGAEAGPNDDASLPQRDDGFMEGAGAEADDSTGIVYAKADARPPVPRAPEVRLVGREVTKYASVSKDTGEEPVYAPIGSLNGEAQSGEIMYATTPAEGEILYASTPAQEAAAKDGVVIESLYSTVEKESDPIRRGTISGGVIAGASEDIYATLESIGTEAPEVPNRQYDKSLLPPTIRVHIDDGDGASIQEASYELLPWQKEGQNELDVDSVAVERRTSHTEVSPPPAGSSPGPALPPRKDTVRAPNGRDSFGSPRHKAEIKLLLKEQKLKRKQLLKEQKDELRNAKREASALKKKEKKDRANAKKEQKLFSKSMKKLKKSGTQQSVAVPSSVPEESENLYDEAALPEDTPAT